MQKIPFNLRTDRYFLYYNEEIKLYYLVDKENSDYLHIAEKEEMQKLINKLENDEETILLDGGLML